MTSRSYLKDIRALIRLAEEQGWQVEHTDSGHLMWTPPIGESLTTSSTPGGGRAMENIRSDLRSRGLVMSRADYRRQKKAMAQEAASIAPERLSLIDRYRKQIEAAAAASNISIAGVADFSDIAVVKLVELIDPDTGRFKLTHDCGRVYAHPLGYLQHTLKCEPDPTPQENNDVDRNMKSPPDRERIECPECPEWFWISQPDLLKQHMIQGHHKDQCPHCLKWYGTRSGGLGKHVRLCVKNPDRLMPIVLPESDGSQWDGFTPLTGDDRVTAPQVVICEKRKTPHFQDELCVSPILFTFEAPAAKLLAEVEKTQQLALENEDLANQLVAAAEQRAQEIIAGAEARVAAAIEAASKDENRPISAPPPQVDNTIRRASNASDDDLWALLEMVLAGPIALNRESFGAINDWMVATRKLFTIMEGS